VCLTDVEREAYERVELSLRERNGNERRHDLGHVDHLLRQQFKPSLSRDAAFELGRLAAVAWAQMNQTPKADRAIASGVIDQPWIEALKLRDEAGSSIADADW
jgi:hypothetical protein